MGSAATAVAAGGDSLAETEEAGGGVGLVVATVGRSNWDGDGVGPAGVAVATSVSEEVDVATSAAGRTAELEGAAGG